MDSKRLAYCSVFHPFRGGIADFNELLIKAFEDYYTVDRWQFEKQYPKALFPGKNQFIENQTFAPNTNLNPINPLSYWSTAKKINSSLPDIFLTTYWMPFFAPALGTIAKQISKDTKKIALLHNVTPHEKRFMDDSLNKYFLSQFDGFITLSKTVTNQLLNFRPNAKHIELFHPIYNQFGPILNKEEMRNKLNLPSDKKIVLFFGFIREYKGLDWLINAIAKTPDTHLIIAGECYEDYNKYESIIEAKGLSERISRYEGFLSNDKTQELFSASDFTVLPYKTATQSGIAAIAKCFNLPLLVTPVGELPSEVTHKEDGFICPAASEEDVAEGLQFMIENHTTFSDKLKTSQKEITWEVFAQKAFEFIESLQ